MKHCWKLDKCNPQWVRSRKLSRESDSTLPANWINNQCRLSGHTTPKSLTCLPLQLHWVAPDLPVRMRRVSSDTTGGRARPFKRFCPVLTHSPHSDLPHPPSRFWCAANRHLQYISGWQSGDSSVFLPLRLVPLSPAARVIGDTFGFLPQLFSPWTRIPRTFLHDGQSRPPRTFSTPQHRYVV